jgi:pyruvate,water dikinase
MKSEVYPFILWFDQIRMDDSKLVGGKNASLGEMYRNLTVKGINIPNGFAITAYAYYYLLEEADIAENMKDILSDLNCNDIYNLKSRGKKIRELILQTEIPPELSAAIFAAYKQLCLQYEDNTDVAVRSSATAEDLPEASFAGQQESFLNVRGEEALYKACQGCFASLFTDRALSYREHRGFDHLSIGLSIGVQKMVRSDLACSGVMFTIDPESGFNDVIYITSAFGLGENVCLGKVNPDEFFVFKPTLKKGYRPIITKRVGVKKQKMIYCSDGNKRVENVPLSKEEQISFSLNDKEVIQLAQWACLIEEYYSQKKNELSPMDIEWAKDGATGELFIVQARPETVHSQKKVNFLEIFQLKEKSKVLAKGRSIGEKIATGKVEVIKNVKEIKSFSENKVLVTTMTDPDWEPIMKKAAGIVTDKGGRTCHAAIVARELNIPCIVGTGNGSKVLISGQAVTLDCASGDEGLIYEGILDYEVKHINLESIPHTKTKVMMNIGNPEQAFEHRFIPNDGVGLARKEFIISSYIKIHPLALCHYTELKNKKVIQQIDKLTFGYENKKQYFVDKLSQGVSRIAAAFYPKEVIVRLSDFKSNEYANLIGGKYFEPKEENPMLGWRGASRYYDENYREAFGLECEALKKVRNDFGLTNVVVMVPFCRTIDEAKKVIEEMKSHGLVQGEERLKIYAMCEIPSNVILAEEFLDIFDGFSIGSNDLTQMVLGLDRDSELVSHIYDENNPAVKKLIKHVIEIANKKGKYIGICGQAPSDFPDFAAFLVECGIGSISLTPDSVLKTRLTIAEKEKELQS